MYPTLEPEIELRCERVGYYIPDGRIAVDTSHEPCHVGGRGYPPAVGIHPPYVEIAGLAGLFGQQAVLRLVVSGFISVCLADTHAAYAAGTQYVAAYEFPV